ncbi:MAG: HAD-IIA family hydrolase [Schaalia hyovaginalis]|uniref:HAD-IIA family hydrolase n=1 Tax=Schaalia hyovaginalis TaxID=29316 RepID=UPI0023F8F6A1|nr:HAD-IIA family hydrolase [Schaalia hyovaginalis]MCI7671824.1 HAD-IIA family hydrolase [Schaalia hyovaginalis]MDY5505329.1 HAD-IIA family hydrolase [Schaalia hyovaginalis]
MTTMNNAPKPLTEMPPVSAWLSDMDGVLVKENRALPGAEQFLDALRRKGYPFLVLTNNSIFTNRDLSARLARSGLDVPEDNIWTSANATAAFLSQQSPDSTAFVIGEAGLTTALHGAGYIMTDQDPEYVVLGETRNYDFNAITSAIRLIESGAKFIATNPDVTGPSDDGTLPATGSIAAMITAATGKRPYFVGKPNPVMIRAGLNKIGAHSERAAMVGDRMDTDIQAGVEAGLRTHLVLSGSTSLEQVEQYPYRPFGIHEGIGELIELVEAVSE